MEYSNELSVAFGALKTKTTKEIYRLDEEQYLVFTDIELPTNFRVDFGLSENGDTISMVGTDNKVLMPDNLLTHAGKLHAWVWVDTGTYGGKTCYHVIVPIKQRGNVTDIQPTPAEQRTIDSLIDALNEGVEAAGDAADAAEAAVTHYPKIVNGYWYVWDPETEAWVDTGVRAEGEGTGIEKIEKTGTQGLVDTYTIYYTNGTTYTYTVTNGAQGQQGPAGPAGVDGSDGEDGVSPEVTITAITGGHRVTITDADHPLGQSFDVMDGQDGSGDGIIADDFSTSISYEIGDYVIYNDLLYRFTDAHTAGAWVGTDATAVLLANDVSLLRSALNANGIYDKLIEDEIPDTVQDITFNASGDVQSITHSANNAAVRTDAFTFAENSITEVRTLSTGQSLTMVTNLTTLETTITYSEGGNG